MSVSPLGSTIVANRFRLDSRIGKGGSGVVWKAHDMRLERRVAMKELVLPSSVEPGERKELQRSVLREARAAARLDHPGAVAVYDIAEDGDRSFIVMELVEARNLAQIVAEDGPLTPASVATLGLQLVDILEAAHHAGIVHRDVKPANVLVPSVGRARLSDFGIATVIDDPSVTATGVLKGTPSYMAPEQALRNETGPNSDLWALGATLYFAVEGKAPFERGTALATLTAIALDEPRPPERAGPIAPVLEQLLVKDPTARPTYQQLRSALQPIVRAQPPAAAPHPGQAPAALASAPPDVPSRTPAAAPSPASAADPSTAPLAGPPPVAAPAAVAGPPPVAAPAAVAGPPPVAGPAPVAAPAAVAGPAPVAAPAAVAAPAPAAAPRPAAAPPENPPPLPSVAPPAPPRSPGAPAVVRRPGPPAKHTAWIAAAVVAVLAVASAGYFLSRSSGRKSPAPGAAVSHSAATTMAPSETGATASGVAVPTGWTSYTDSATGFKVAYPPTWQVVRNGTLTDFRDPATGTYLRIDHQTPPAPTADGPWYALEKPFSANNPGYVRLGITKTVFHGDSAAIWEYTYLSGSVRLHAIDLGMIHGNFGFGFNFQTTDAAWSAQQPLLSQLENAFQA